MQTDPMFDLPGRLVTLIKDARDLGWRCDATYADLGEITVALRFNKDDLRAYGLWSAEEKVNAKGKNTTSVSWKFGGCRCVRPGAQYTRQLAQVGMLSNYLGIAKKVKDAPPIADNSV